MFVLILHYKASLDEVMKHLDAHRVYLDRYYAEGKFFCSGPQNPRTGGCILCHNTQEAEIKKIIQEDPFLTEGVADYEVIEVLPTQCVPEFEKFIH